MKDYPKKARNLKYIFCFVLFCFFPDKVRMSTRVRVGEGYRQGERGKERETETETETETERQRIPSRLHAQHGA